MMDGRMDEWMDGWMGGWIDRWIGGWMSLDRISGGLSHSCAICLRETTYSTNYFASNLRDFRPQG